MKVSGKVLVVTGAGSGIGRAVALEALKRGARVAAVDLNAETLDETAARAHAGELGGGKCSSEPSFVLASFLSSSGAPPSTMRAVPVTAR